MGGMAIMALADRHPQLVADRVTGVAFVATSSSEMRTASLGLPHPLGMAALRLERWGMGALAVFGAGRLPLPPGVLGPLTRWLAFGAAPRAADVAAVSALAAACRLGGIAGLRRTIDAHDCRLALITFDGLPAVVLVGDEDRVTPVRHAAVIAQWLPHARLVVLPGAGHMLPLERAVELAGALEAVLDGARAEWDRTVAAGWRATG
jgi:pimeloyl-ACP methyl ester carboxylesterase